MLYFYPPHMLFVPGLTPAESIIDDSDSWAACHFLPICNTQRGVSRLAVGPRRCLHDGCLHVRIHVLVDASIGAAHLPDMHVLLVELLDALLEARVHHPTKSRRTRAVNAGVHRPTREHGRRFYTYLENISASNFFSTIVAITICICSISWGLGWAGWAAMPPPPNPNAAEAIRAPQNKRWAAIAIGMCLSSRALPCTCTVDGKGPTLILLWWRKSLPVTRRAPNRQERDAFEKL